VGGRHLVKGTCSDSEGGKHSVGAVHCEVGKLRLVLGMDLAG